MTEFVITLTTRDSQRLEQAALRNGKSAQTLVQEWIARLLDSNADFDIEQDPIFQMQGYDSQAPSDLAANLDHYLYGKGLSQ